MAEQSVSEYRFYSSHKQCLVFILIIITHRLGLQSSLWSPCSNTTTTSKHSWALKNDDSHSLRLPLSHYLASTQPPPHLHLASTKRPPSSRVLQLTKQEPHSISCLETWTRTSCRLQALSEALGAPPPCPADSAVAQYLHTHLINEDKVAALRGTKRGCEETM